jgi:LuxR family transcriptional regulator, maltose regulon positive regulatory protein
LAEWASREARRVAWVSLDRFDNDPASLVALLAAAYTRVDPGRPDLAAQVGGPGRSVLGRAAPRLAAAFGTSPAPFVLILDDLHELASPACHDVLGLLVSRLPAGSQLVTASRAEQPHLPHLRASGTAMELGPSDLALDAEGAQQVFAAEGVSLSPEGAAALAERTEGWPVGLHLAALVARDGGDEAGAVSGDDRYVADYLYAECLSHQSEETQQFLRRAAVLHQLCGPLCDAVLGSSGSAARLRQLEAASLFVLPLDRRREWYRLHSLFREFLVGELRRCEPDVIEKLHLRAADWYEGHGMPALAIEHLLSTVERGRAAQLVCQIYRSAYSAGQRWAVVGWVSSFSDADIERYPPLAVIAARAAVAEGDTRQAERWAAFLGTASFVGAMPDGSASFDSARAMLRVMMCAHGLEAMMADATLAYTEEPPWSPWRIVAVWGLAEAHLLAGHREEAGALLQEASDKALETNYPAQHTEAELALLAMGDGDWETAAQHVSRVLAMIDERGMEDYPASPLAFAAAARLALHRGELDEARRQLARAMRGRASSTYVDPALAVRVRLELARAHLDLADSTTAHHLSNEASDILARRPALGTLVDQAEQLKRDLERSQLEPTGPAPLSTAELRLLPYLQTHLSQGAIAERLFVSRATVSSQVVSIYRKLGVSTRSAAVEQATERGLLGV